MIIKLNTIQIPTYWEVIKHATAKTNQIESSEYRVYFTNLLADLLTDKSHCFVGFDEDRKLLWLTITKNITDKISRKKYLLIQSLYGFQKLSDQIWIDYNKFIHLFAEHTKCKALIFDSNNERILSMARKFNYRIRYTSMIYNLGGD